MAVEQLADEAPGSFDVVTCMEMLEHVPDPESVIDACARLASRGGTVCFSTLNRNTKSFALAIVGAAMQFFDGLLPFDFNIFNPMDWFDLAGRYGVDSWLLAHRWIAGLGAALSLLFIGSRDQLP